MILNRTCKTAPQAGSRRLAATSEARAKPERLGQSNTDTIENSWAKPSYTDGTNNIDNVIGRGLFGTNSK